MKKAILFLCVAALLLPSFYMVSCGNKPTPSSNINPNENNASNDDSTEQIGSEDNTHPEENEKPDTDNNNSQNQNDSGLPPYTGPAFKESTPAIYIQTENGAHISTNKQEVDCLISLRSNEYDQCADGLPATIRARGNGSLGAAASVGKLPYKIKFRTKINLFMLGDGKAKDWVLLDHVGEQTMLRNYAARLMGDMLDGIPYSTNSRLVNVYLNNEYVGVYELAEQVEVGKYRINVDDTRSEAENGFLVELDAYASEIYVSVGGQNYTVKSNVYNDEQLNFIRDYLQQVENAIYNNNPSQLMKLVNMNSLVDMYIVQEYAKNIDVGWSSFYMYRDVGGKLTFAPPWDFDLSFGNDDRLDGGSYEGLYVGTNRGMIQDHKWYNALFQYDWFRKIIANRWAEVSETVIPKLIQAVRYAAAQISADMQKNYARWRILGQRRHQEPYQIYTLTSYKQHIDYLLQWMQNRKAWLDIEFSTF